MNKLSTFIVTLVFQTILFAQSGTFDTQFFDGGEYIFFENPAISPNSSVEEMLKDSDGNFLVCGQSSNSGSINPAYIMKFTPNGQLVQSFGNGGVAYFSENSPVLGSILSIKQLQNGNYVILTGSVFGSPNSTKLLLFEISQNGTLIEGFGNGNATFTIQGNIFSIGMDVSPQGKIWVHFNKINQPNIFTTSSNSYALQFNQDGSLNTSFGNAGLFEFGQNEADERVFDIAFDQNENAYLCGGYRAGSTFGVLGELFVLGVQSNGQLKTDFAQSGVFKFGDNIASYGIKGIECRNEELIFCGFRFQSNDGEKGIIAKLNLQGALITSFGNAGWVSFDQTNSAFNSLTVDNLGRIIALGYMNNSSTNDDDVIVVLFSGNGLLQTNFGNNGSTTPWDLNNIDDKPQKVLLTNNGLGIIATGTGFSSNGGGDGFRNLQTGDYGFLLKYQFDQPSSVIDQNNVRFQLYPNPANNLLFIESKSAIEEVKIFDISGKLIESIAFNQQSQTIDISHLPNGIYVLQVDDSVFKKFVVFRE